MPAEAESQLQAVGTGGPEAGASSASFSSRGHGKQQHCSGRDGAMRVQRISQTVVVTHGTSRSSGTAPTITTLPGAFVSGSLMSKDQQAQVADHCK